MSTKAAQLAETMNELLSKAIEQSCKCWNAQDYRGLHDLWDPGEVEPWYVAEDIDAPLIGWAVIESYWQTYLGLSERDDLTHGELQTKRLGRDLALAIYGLRFRRRVTGPQQTPEGESRVTALFRYRNKSWRFVYLMEASVSSLIALRRQFESGSDTGPEPKTTP